MSGDSEASLGLYEDPRFTLEMSTRLAMLETFLAGLRETCKPSDNHKSWQDLDPDLT